MTGFVKVKGSRFSLDNKPYTIKGANYWQGMNLGARKTHGGDRYRLLKELDQMKKMGVNNLRVMASSEGPDDQPYRMRPSLQPAPGKYNEAIFEGLDFLLSEMDKRNMTAVMTLSNFWHWSGGFSQYLNWITGEEIPYPNLTNDWDLFTNFTRRFYVDEHLKKKANQMYKSHIRTVQKRKNKYNGKRYNQDPTIMSWQIANEAQLGPKEWFEDIAKFIKEGAPHQLVTSGIESKVDQVDFVNAHESSSIDYCTCHCWVENWGFYDPTKQTSLTKAIEYVQNYTATRHEWASDLGKPIVLEEFGMARDAWRHPNDTKYKYDPKTPTSNKDKYYKAIYHSLDGYAGSAFWAYGGLGRSTDQPNEYGMVWLGDPPHEPRGWYSVYNTDTTASIISNYYHGLSA